MSVAVDTSRQRVVFGDQVEPGMTLLVRCSGRYCRNGTTHAVELGTVAEHELTILHLRKTEYDMGAVTIDEDGNQQPWTGRLNEPIRVRA